jgi:hypothetical protein
MRAKNQSTLCWFAAATTASTAFIHETVVVMTASCVVTSFCPQHGMPALLISPIMTKTTTGRTLPGPYSR